MDYSCMLPNAWVSGGSTTCLSPVLCIKNINKARKAQGNIGAFYGSLNPPFGRSNASLKHVLFPFSSLRMQNLAAGFIAMIKILESFQCEIGHRILRLPKRHSNTVVKLDLQWPLVLILILIHKPTFLAKLLSDTDDIISSGIFTSLTIIDVYNMSIINIHQNAEADV